MYEFLRKIPLFADLSEADLRHLCEMTQEVQLKAGEELFAEGSQGDRAYIVREGALEVLKAASGRQILLNVCHAGEIIGETALVEKKPRMASVRARRDSVLLSLHKEQFDHLLETSSSASKTMFYIVLERWRETESALRQSEKMAQLGTLSAGIAHELNNPAAAVKRGADQLQSALIEFERTQAALVDLGLNAAQKETLESLRTRAREMAGKPSELDALARSDREYALESWLDERGMQEAWICAPTLVNLAYDAEELTALAEAFEAGQVTAVILWLNSTYTAYNLLKEIGQGAGRISEIVKALKSYSYLDQAPVQAVNVHEGLDDTLLILRHKLKTGISVRRDYAADLPTIQGYGSELNQVWTNLIDNAADALNGKGEITLRTRREGDWVIVAVEDNGPGIPPEVKPRLFDPFFTTKPPGQGTGLGLDISYRIVVHKHQGDIRVYSEPGRTRFEVWLPTESQTNGNTRTTRQERNE